MSRRPGSLLLPLAALGLAACSGNLTLTDDGPGYWQVQPAWSPAAE